MKNFVKFSILFLTIAVVLSSCKKDPEFVSLGNNEPHSNYVLGDMTLEISSEWEKYVNGVVTDNVITVSPSIGTALQMPKVGEILLYPGISEKFPHGFLGKVTEISEGRIVTESVALDEAFKKLTIDYDNIDIAQYVGEVTDADGNPVVRSKNKMLKSSGDWEVEEIAKFTINGYLIGNSSSPAKVELKGEISVGMTLSWKEVIDNGSTYQRFTITPEFKIETDIIAELSGDNNGAIKIGHIPFTIPAGPVPLYCEVEIFAGVDVEGKISLSAGMSYSHSTTFGFEYNGSLKGIKENSDANGFNLSIGKLTIDGRIGIGPSIKGSIYLFKVNNVSASIEIEGEALLAHKLEFEWDPIKALDGGLYETLKNSKAKRSFILGAELGFSLELGKWVEFNPKVSITYEKIISEEWLLPQTTDLLCLNHTSTNKTVKYRLKDDVFFPGRYGMLFYDENKNTISTLYFNDKSAYISQLPDNPVSFPFTLPDGATTYASPVYNLFGLEFVDYQTNIKLHYLSDDILDIIPDEYLDILEEFGLIINGGKNPPYIEGTYLATPLDLVASNVGTNIAEMWDMYVTFSEQNNANLTVNADYSMQTDWGSGISTMSSSGPGSFIVGEGNKFTVFVDGTREEMGYTAKTVEVFSGEISTSGIINYQWAVIMVNNNGNPLGHWIANGTGYLKKDSDGLSERVPDKSPQRKEKMQKIFNRTTKSNVILQ